VSASPEIVIIGAGVAGLTAARGLSAAGMRVLVLEARDRLGGRIATRHTAGGPVELGAEFVHGAFDEILGVVEEAGLRLRESGRPEARADEGGEARPRFMSAMDTLLALASPGGADESFAHLVDRVDAAPELKTQALRFVEGYHAADPARISVQSLIRNTAADERPGGERQFRFAEGYDHLVEAIVHRIDTRLCNVHRNAAVTAVEWQPGRVVVHTSGGAEFTAPRAIVTVPISVLKAGAIQFTPSLEAKAGVLGVLEMGGALRASLGFDGEWWARQEEFSVDGFVVGGEPPFPVWWVSNPPPFPVITGWAAGPNARALAGLTEEQRVSAALKALARLLEVDVSRLAREVRCAFSHDWQVDPFSRGAYSYAAVGGSDAGQELAVPLAGTLYFAGEATESDGQNATVHGAIASARRVVNEVLRG
jgi:monoamine oxidase